MSEVEVPAECSEDEAHYALTIMFAKDVATAVQALRAYGDLRATLAVMPPAPPPLAERAEVFFHRLWSPWCWVFGHRPSVTHLRCARCWRPG